MDVIIIGAGWAGMAAADSLARANVSFVVLEATNRTGGRTHALTFGDPAIWRGVVERGKHDLLALLVQVAREQEGSHDGRRTSECRRQHQRAHRITRQ